MGVALVLASVVFQELRLCPACMPCFAAGLDRCVQREYARTVYSKRFIFLVTLSINVLLPTAEVICHMHRSECGTFQTSEWWTGRTCMKW